MRVDSRPVARLAAEQLVDRHTKRLALEVPQRGVDAADCAQQNWSTAPESAPVHVLPDVFDRERVTADDELLQMLVCAEDAMIATAQTAFADAVDARVGLDLDDVDEVTIGEHRGV